jgi:hypothetical protein
MSVRTSTLRAPLICSGSQGNAGRRHPGRALGVDVGDAEVEQLWHDAAVRPCQKYVLRFQVSVHDAPAVGEGHCLDDGEEDRHRIIHRQPVAHL